MLNLKFATASLSLTLCSLNISAEPRPLNTAEIDMMVNLHNDFRKSVAKEESLRLNGLVEIPPLTWDPQLADVAQEWANLLNNKDPQPMMCHRCGSGACNPPLIQNQCAVSFGENIHYSFSSGEPTLSPELPFNGDVQKEIPGWKEEQEFYTYDSNSCALGEQCGHYTQMIWYATRSLGCGRARRKDAQGTYHLTWVCNYSPAGNIEEEWPYYVVKEVPPERNPPNPQHFVEVLFQKIRVHECNEVGTCAWRLFCGIGSQQTSILLDNVDGDDLTEPPINRSLTSLGTLPITITCRLEERDAPIYEHIGTKTITYNTGGFNFMRINRGDEGDVSVFFDIQTKVR